MIATEEPILSRLDRLDTILRHLEERRASNNNKSARSSYASSSGTPTTDGQDASFDFSPRSVEKNHCRPIDDVRSETHLKGNLLDRMVQLEDRVLKLEVELEPPENKAAAAAAAAAADGKKKHKKGLRQLVRSFVQGHKDN